MRIKLGRRIRRGLTMSTVTIADIAGVCRQTATGCWEKNQPGIDNYRLFRIGGKLITAHRLAWVVTNGPVPDELLVCHRCNNKRCMNPAHLYVATQQQNIADAGRDGLLTGGRQLRGAALTNKNRARCKSGHEFTTANTFTYKSGKRACRECRRGWGRAYYHRKAA